MTLSSTCRRTRLMWAVFLYLYLVLVQDLDNGTIGF